MFKKYIAAVSGGPDSMALLSKYRKKIIGVCIVNYKKRKSADYDAQCAVEYCKLYNIKYYILNVDKNVYKKYKNITNFQTKARVIRYNFFGKIAEKINCFNLLVAHNLDDFIESAYMQEKKESKALFYGIKPRSSFRNVQIYRPLLNVRKETLIRYCHEKSIKFGVDETNQMDIYERNKTRNIIKEWKTDEVFEFLQRIKKYNKKNSKKIKKITKEYSNWKVLNYSIKYFSKLEEFYKYYLVYEFLKEHSERNRSSKKINSIMKYISKNNGIKNYRLENGKILALKNRCLIIKER